VESIEALEDAIDAYDGTVVLVSHDRELLRKLVTRVWELRDGQMRVFDGEFAEWEETREREKQEATARAEQQAAAARERDKQANKKRAQDDTRSRAGSRDAKRDAEQAEHRAQELDEVVARLTRELADPALYADMKDRARVDQLTRELAEARTAMAAAMDAWERAMEAVDALSR
jgi:ATP-binding cassette subfamily F protein 3